MVRIGVTGHMNLTADTAVLVSEALHAHLRQVGGDMVGVSCIARGADSLFAEAVLEAGGTLEVVLPSRNYREAKVKPDHAEQFDRLLSKAALVRTMPFDHASREAYVAANEAVLESVDELLAVWDGVPTLGQAGTADVVAEARERGVPVTVVWPEGSARG
ncbi:hypothetical protein OG320_23630 [Microbispora sp. NBC_01189]|uniref:hypothetical protein n=1 Tax=Microbispora sp. NBC_01189 TaxID=2903583 RepID=UPI002E0D7069|nr:hypothetical protein OG320_23630 [Microbispora sp. NBC_01189]